MKVNGYAVCVENRGYPAALEVQKIYRILDDALAQAEGLVRVIDESGEDYLYPHELFVPIEVPRAAVRAFTRKTQVKASKKTRVKAVKKKTAVRVFKRRSKSTR
jgi:hypothetical protein